MGHCIHELPTAIVYLEVNNSTMDRGGLWNFTSAEELLAIERVLLFSWVVVADRLPMFMQARLSGLFFLKRKRKRTCRWEGGMGWPGDRYGNFFSKAGHGRTYFDQSPEEAETSGSLDFETSLFYWVSSLSQKRKEKRKNEIKQLRWMDQWDGSVSNTLMPTLMI